MNNQPIRNISPDSALEVLHSHGLGLRTAAATLLLPVAGLLLAIGFVLAEPESTQLEFRPLPPVAIEVPDVNPNLYEDESE